jgi:hypothetical protein
MRAELLHMSCARLLDSSFQRVECVARRALHSGVNLNAERAGFAMVCHQSMQSEDPHGWVRLDVGVICVEIVEDAISLDQLSTKMSQIRTSWEVHNSSRASLSALNI